MYATFLEESQDSRPITRKWDLDGFEVFIRLNSGVFL